MSKVKYTIVGDEGCPSCQSIGKDSSGNHLIVFSNGGKHCNRCKYTVLPSGDTKGGYLAPTKGGESTGLTLALDSHTTNHKESMEDINSLPTGLEIPERGISKDTTAFYGVRFGLSQSDGSTITEHYYPYYLAEDTNKLTGYKKRLLPKKFYSVGTLKAPVTFFGQQKFSGGGKKLLITGGELDTLAGYQMLKKKYPQSSPQVVSLPKGEASISAFKDNIDFIQSYEEVIVATDMDDAGRKMAKDIASLLGRKALLMSFSEKDASDMLKHGKEEEFISAFYSARPYRPECVVTVDDVYEEAIKMPEWGLSYPWPSLTQLTYGIREKECIYLGAGVGIGKTDWALQLQEHIINHHKQVPGLFMLEQPVARTLKTLAGKFAGIPFHKPDAIFTHDQLKEGIDRLRGKVLLYNHFGTKDWETVKQAIRIMVMDDGVKQIFIDPLTALVSHLSSSEANDELNKIAGELASMAHELSFTVFGFSHLNPPKTGKPHERGGKVHESQFTGSRGLMRYGHYLFGIERDKDPELDEDVRNTSNFVLLKDREFGSVGSFEIFYNKNSTTYLEPPR